MDGRAAGVSVFWAGGSHVVVVGCGYVDMDEISDQLCFYIRIQYEIAY